MIKTKEAFLKGRFLSSQSEQFKKYSKSSDWLGKTQYKKFRLKLLTITDKLSRKRNDFTQL